MTFTNKKKTSWILIFIAYYTFSTTLTVGQQNGELSSLTNKNSGERSNDENKNLLSETNNPIKVQYVNVNGSQILVSHMFTYTGPPRLLPIPVADNYPQGSTVNLICTVSGGQRKGLNLSWFKGGQEVNEELLRYTDSFGNISVEKTGDISILKINNATLDDSGQFACNAKNEFGTDSNSVNIVIVAPLEWSKVPKTELEVALNQDISVECDATGFPQPTIEWTRHSNSDHPKSNGTLL